MTKEELKTSNKEGMGGMAKKFFAIFNVGIYQMFPRPFQKCNLSSKSDLIGVEIGVFQGENALSLLKTSNIKMLYLIDPFIESEAYTQNEISKAFNKAKKKLRKYKNKITWIVKKSEEATNEIPNNLDFVYIDGSHLYEDVKKDIELYYPKLKEGGLLAGDDFPKSKYDDGKENGVNEAVLKFVKKRDLALYTLLQDWWVNKVEDKTQPEEVQRKDK